MKRSLTIFLSSTLLFFICGAPTISFRVLKPSILIIPAYINSIGVIDRSVQTKSSGNILEGVLTGEIPGGDRITSQYALEGLMNITQNSGRFNVIRTTKSFMKDTAPENFPEPLSWDEVEKLCSDFKVDAIVSLEIFDTDYIIPTGMTRVSIGFRFYDIKERNILDQKIITKEMVWEGSVNSIAGAINRITDKERAIKDVSYDAGMIYGERISPSWSTIQREYYRKPKKDLNLREGARMMEVNDWDAAIDALQRALESNKRKIKGRAAHNLAVVYEILGDYEQAQLLARDAWGKYENKDSKNYSYIIGQRIRENQILQEQKSRE